MYFNFLDQNTNVNKYITSKNYIQQYLQNETTVIECSDMLSRLLHELLKWNDVVKMKHMLRTNVTHFSKSDNTFFVICFISNVQIHAERHFVLSKHKKSISAVKIEADT